MSNEEVFVGLHIEQVVPGWYVVSQPQDANGTLGEVGRLNVKKDGGAGAMIEHWYLYLETKEAEEGQPKRFKFLLLGTNDKSQVHLEKSEDLAQPTGIKHQYIKCSCAIPEVFEALGERQGAE